MRDLSPAESSADVILLKRHEAVYIDNIVITAAAYCDDCFSLEGFLRYT